MLINVISWSIIFLLLSILCVLLACIFVSQLFLNNWKKTIVLLLVVLYGKLFPKRRLHSYKTTINKKLYQTAQSIVKSSPEKLLDTDKFESLEDAKQFKIYVKELLKTDSYKLNDEQALKELKRQGLNHFFTTFNLYLLAMSQIDDETFKELLKTDNDQRVQSSQSFILGGFASKQADNFFKSKRVV